MPKGLTLTTRLLRRTMTIQRYQAADLPDLFDKITKNSIGFDNFFNSVWDVPNQTYPPYNIINLNNHESRLEIALAGFKKDEVKVYTEYGQLHVEGTKTDKEDVEYFHRGLAGRSFERVWKLTDDSEVKSVAFEDGLLTVDLKKIVPEYHQRKNYLGVDKNS